MPKSSTNQTKFTLQTSPLNQSGEQLQWQLSLPTQPHPTPLQRWQLRQRRGVEVVAEEEVTGEVVVEAAEEQRARRLPLPPPTQTKVTRDHDTLQREETATSSARFISVGEKMGAIVLHLGNVQ